MSDEQERPAKRWELARLEARIALLERELEKITSARSWWQRTVILVALSFIAQGAILILGVYVFKR